MMNWNYFKFTVSSYKNALFFWLTLIGASYFIPVDLFEEAGEAQMFALIFIAIMSGIRISSYDLLSSVQSAGKSTSIKYMLSLNMSKKELYINYICSYFILMLPTFLAVVLTFVHVLESTSTFGVAFKTAYLGCGLIFFIASSAFYKRYLNLKEGTFQDQYWKGKRAYQFRLVATILASLCGLMLLVNEFTSLSIPAFYIFFLPFVIPVTIIVYGFLYVPFVPLYIFYEYKKSLRDFNNPHFFHGVFRNEKKEMRLGMMFVAISFSTFMVDTPPPTFSGNKLTEAIYHEDFESIKKYATADHLNKLSQEGLSPLAAAAYTGQWETYQFLKGKGANVYPEVTLEKRKHNLLHLSILGKNTQIIEDVIDLGEFDINTTDEFGNTPLHYVATTCQSNMAKLLTSKGAQVNMQNSNGQTPLHISVQKSCDDLALVLLSLGADPALQDKKNKVALDLKRNNILPYLEEQLRKPASVEEMD